jgi:hypothetical protein
LEILCIQIIAEDSKPRLEETLQQFSTDVGGTAYTSDEYRMASELKEALEAKDFKKLEVLTKKPLFSFIETEITRCLKRFVLNPPPGMIEGEVLKGAGT